MKIELKNVYSSDRLSQESTAFNASLYINGVKAGMAWNEGHGGTTFYRATTDAGLELIPKAESYCLKLRSFIYSNLIINGKPARVNMNLERFIDKLVSDHLSQKDLTLFRRKMERDMVSGILFGEMGKGYRILKYQRPIEELLKTPAGAERVKKGILTLVLPKLNAEDSILNTNIPTDFLNSLGIGGNGRPIVQKPLKRKRLEKGQNLDKSSKRNKSPGL